MQKKFNQSLGFLAVLASMNATQAIDPDTFLLYSKGPLALKPQFSFSETFNDNVTYRDVDPQHDFITSISPGLALQIGRKDLNFLELSYFYERLIYADNSEFDANQHHIKDQVHFQKSRLRLDGSDVIDFLSSPLGGGFSSGTAEGGIEGLIAVGGRRVDRWSFYDVYRLTWDATERADLYLQAIHSYLDYAEGLALYDSRTLTGTLGFEYHPFAKAYLFGETYFGQTENDPNSSVLEDYPRANFVGMFVGARGEITEKLRGTVKAGFEHRYYADHGDPLDSPVVELSVDAQLTEKSLLSAGYTRHQYESIQRVHSSYVANYLFLNWLQKIGADGRLNSEARLAYQLSNFQKGATTQDRSDNLLRASLTISYDIKLWMRAFASYAFEHLDSDDQLIVDYNANRVTLGLQFGY